MWRQREYECGGRFAPGDGAAQGLGFKAAQLLHEVAALHERHVSKVQVAQDLVFEAASTFLNKKEVD